MNVIPAAIVAYFDLPADLPLGAGPVAHEAFYPEIGWVPVAHEPVTAAFVSAAVRSGASALGVRRDPHWGPVVDFRIEGGEVR